MEHQVNHLDRARRDCSADAEEAVSLIHRMKETHANLYVVVDAIREVVSEVTWGDASDSAASLAEALEHLASVYATPERRAA